MSMPAFIALDRVSAVVDCFQPKKGTIDARDPSAISVSFPIADLGHPTTIIQSATRMFDDAGYSVVSDTSDTQNIHFVLCDQAA